MYSTSQLLSDVGSSNPIVARLIIQTCELIQPIPIELKQKEDIIKILGENVCERLVKCFKICRNIRNKVNVMNEYKFDQLVQSKSIEIPSIIELRQDCESFLYQAKLALRDLSEIFSVFYIVEYCGDVYKKSNYKVYGDWACNTFGADDYLSKGIKEEEVWIKKIKDMRDAVEHPSEESKLLIHNIKLVTDRTPSYLKEPKWNLTGDNESSIRRDMEKFIENILSFSEELLIALLKKALPNKPIIFEEIPVEERDRDCPIRFKIGLDLSKMELKKQ